MEKLDRIATHLGKVTDVREGLVVAEMEAVSACASCQAHSRCGFAESKNKIVEVPTADWQQYKKDEVVNIQIDEQHGLLAVLIAYVVPSIVMLAVIIVLSVMGVKEVFIIVSALGLLAVYTLVLYFTRGKVNNKFVLSVSKC
ncbi:MAG: SoxR reducing system RseC family protein [Bacteroidales bacterium]|nr:SoxR reducing system RseC family protein [Bacteroidales bacterium]